MTDRTDMPMGGATGGPGGATGVADPIEGSKASTAPTSTETRVPEPPYILPVDKMPQHEGAPPKVLQDYVEDDARAIVNPTPGYTYVVARNSVEMLDAVIKDLEQRAKDFGRKGTIDVIWESELPHPGNIVTRVYAFEDYRTAKEFSMHTFINGTLYSTVAEAAQHARHIADGN